MKELFRKLTELGKKYPHPNVGLCPCGAQYDKTNNQLAIAEMCESCLDDLTDPPTDAAIGSADAKGEGK